MFFTSIKDDEMITTNFYTVDTISQRQIILFLIQSLFRLSQLLPKDRKFFFGFIQSV